MEKDFLHIIDQHQGIIYKVCKLYRTYKDEQEDLFQDIVLQLWRAYPKFRGESKVSTWIYRIAINTSITSFRKKNAPIELQEHLPADNWHTENIEPSENEEKMFQAIRMLKKEDRALIALFLEDYSYREIAQIIGISENYVAVKMSRIKDKLKDILKS